MKHVLGLAVIACLGWASSPAYAQTPSERGRDPWVYRSVLDGQARIITCALAPRVWVAYDGYSGQLHKVWAEGVSLEGPVYNLKHGPQPRSKGHPYFLNDTKAANWMLYNAQGQLIPVLPQFQGYTWKDNKVVFETKLVGKDISVTVTEWPEVYSKPYGKEKYEVDQLQRVLTTSGMPEGYRLELRTTIGNMPGPQAYEVSGGKWYATSKTERLLGAASVYDQSGMLILKPNGETRLASWIYPVN